MQSRATDDCDLLTISSSCKIREIMNPDHIFVRLSVFFFLYKWRIRGTSGWPPAGVGFLLGLIPGRSNHLRVTSRVARRQSERRLLRLERLQQAAAPLLPSLRWKQGEMWQQMRRAAARNTLSETRELARVVLAAIKHNLKKKKSVFWQRQIARCFCNQQNPCRHLPEPPHLPPKCWCHAFSVCVCVIGF